MAPTRKKRRPRASKVIYGYRKVHRNTRSSPGKRGKRISTEVEQFERSLESLWMDTIPEGYNPLTWLREWNDGYPSEETIDLYNSIHDEDEHIALEESDDEDG